MAMGFLGRLGIDLKILLIQLINFALLLWLLSRFLYQPILRMIQKEEEELEKKRQQEKALAKEKREWERERKMMIEEAKKKSRRIVEEAEELAERIKIRAQRQARNQARKRLILDARRGEGRRRLDSWGVSKGKILASLSLSLKEKVPSSVWQKIQDWFWEKMLEELADWMGKRNWQDGRVILESAFPLEKRKRQELVNLLARRGKVKILEKVNPDLLSGFRLGVGGEAIEFSLSKILKDALEE